MCLKYEYMKLPVYDHTLLISFLVLIMYYIIN